MGGNAFWINHRFRHAVFNRWMSDGRVDAHTNGRRRAPTQPFREAPGPHSLPLPPRGESEKAEHEERLMLQQLRSGWGQGATEARRGEGGDPASYMPDLDMVNVHEWGPRPPCSWRTPSTPEAGARAQQAAPPRRPGARLF